MSTATSRHSEYPVSSVVLGQTNDASLPIGRRNNSRHRDKQQNAPVLGESPEGIRPICSANWADPLGATHHSEDYSGDPASETTWKVPPEVAIPSPLVPLFRP